MSEMQEGDPERLKEIIASLSPEDQEVFRRFRQTMYENSMRGAAAAIMARNFSHGIGSYVLSNVATRTLD
ncbi:MAG: hypothetical protein WC516_02210 [Patescibacteria group bacterium]